MQKKINYFVKLINSVDQKLGQGTVGMVSLCYTMFGDLAEKTKWRGLDPHV